jgi:hypothetical protein
MSNLSVVLPLLDDLQTFVKHQNYKWKRPEKKGGPGLDISI